MHTLLARARRRLSFANVASALALFIALGGTSYAAIARNSVDSRHIRSGAVARSEVRTGAIGKSEIRTNAVGKSEVSANGVGAAEVRRGAIDETELRDGGVAMTDLATDARAALTQTSAVTFRVSARSTGAVAGGNAKSVARSAAGEYTVELGRDVSACQYSATLAAAGGEQPPAALITAAPAAERTQVVVKTFRPDGTALDAPFHLLVAC
jgi:hypothetical protein